MAKILVIGGGAMGSAFTIPCLDNKNNVTITEPYSKQFINNLKSKNKFHSVLKIKLPKKLKFRIFSKELLKEKFNLIVIALSLPGINFISKELKNIKNKTPILILTKGLKYDKKRNKILTISEQIKIDTKNKNISVLKGPCLAKELAKKNQTKVIIANKNINIAKKIGKLISTNYYLVEYSTDIIGVEVCSAIKNIYAMVIGAGQSLNMSSSLFQKSLLEMKYLTKYFNGKETTVESLAGVGDLYVSAAGGRNSKMGAFIGEGIVFSEAKKTKMPNITIEGAELIFEIGKKVKEDFDDKKLPLMIAMINAILEDKKLDIKWENFNK